MQHISFRLTKPVYEITFMQPQINALDEHNWTTQHPHHITIIKFLKLVYCLEAYSEEHTYIYMYSFSELLIYMLDLVRISIFFIAIADMLIVIDHKFWKSNYMINYDSVLLLKFNTK